MLIRKVIKKRHKIWIILLAALVVFPASIYLILRSSAVQTYITARIASYLSEKLKTEVHVGGVDVSWFMKVVLEDVSINDQQKKPLLRVHRLKTGLESISFRKNTIVLREITLSDAGIHFTTYKSDSTLNLQFIIDYFTSTDTVSSPAGKSWKIKCNRIRIENTRFSFRNENENLSDTIKGINFNNLNILIHEADFMRLMIKGDTVSALIKNLSFEDRSGFKVNKFAAGFSISSRFLIAENLKIVTPSSDLDLDLRFFYKDFSCFADFLNQVNIRSVIRYSRLDLTDIAYFAHPLFSIPNRIKLATMVNGPVSNLKLKNFYLEFGSKGVLHANIHLKGLPDIERTFMQVNIAALNAGKSDIESVIVQGKPLAMPAQLLPLGYVNIKGYFSGYYNSFRSKVDAKTEIGHASAELEVYSDKKNKQVSYKGTVLSNKFDLGKLLSAEDLGDVTLNASVDGTGLAPENANIHIAGNIDTIRFRNYSYKNISVNGDYVRKAFSGKIRVQDVNLAFQLNGDLDFSTQIPRYQFTADINTFNPNYLHLIKSDSIYSLSGKVNINLIGSNIDNFNGSAQFTDFQLSQNKAKLKFDNLKMVSVISNSGYRSISLNTDYLDAGITGEFKPDQLMSFFGEFVSTYIPSLNMDIGDVISAESLAVQNFDFSVKLKNINPALKLFVPGITIAKNSYIEGSYNSQTGNWKLYGNSPEISFSGMLVKNWEINGYTDSKYLFAETKASHFNFTDSIGIDKPAIHAKIMNDSIFYHFKWQQEEFRKLKNNGNIQGILSLSNRPFVENYFLLSQAYINDSLWYIEGNSMVRIDSALIQISNLNIHNRIQALNVNGIISEKNEDQLKINLKKFNLSNFDIITKKSGLNFDGTLNGDVILYHLLKSPNFLTDIKVNNLCLNDDKLGDAYINTTWDEKQKGIYIKSDVIYIGNKGQNTPLAIEGFYYPEKNIENNNFDLKVDIKAFRIKTIASYLSSFATVNDGKATGRLFLKGPTSSPELTGVLSLSRVEMKIDYLNTTYTFGHDMIFEKDGFRFDNLVLNDIHGRQSLFNGKIYHKNFSDFKLDLEITPMNFMLLNTNASQNETFYGTAYATGKVKIHGPVSDLVFDIAAKTDKGTRLFIPISSATSVSDNYFVRFIQKKDTLNEPDNQDEELSGITLNFDFEVTPDAAIQIDLNYETGGVIKANGSGNVKMGIDTKGTFKMFGNYIIDEGSYFLNLENLFNKSFKIDKGSSIKWNGSMDDAMVDINAVYRTRASLYDLRNNPLLVTPDTSRKRVPVDCIIHLKDNLFSPTVTFEIDFPTLPEMMKEQYLTVVNSNLNFQFLSLLVLNQFIDNNPDKSNYTDKSGSTEAVGANAAEALSNQLSNWLSKISRNFDIGVKYRPGTHVTNDELEVALSTQLLNDRLLIDGNLGVGGMQKYNATQNSSNIVGDVNIEYKVTEDGAIRVKAFNRSNNNNYTINDAPYTQGIGVFYRKEFDNIKELFKRTKKKKK